MEHDGLGRGERQKKKNEKVRGRGQEVDDGGSEMRYELKLSRMENE